MNIKQKSNEFRSIVNKMADLYEKKNSNYGDSFGQLYKELGPTAGLVPLWNKLHRATSLIKGDENHFESLEDTLKDLACYAIMNLIEMRSEQESKCQSASNVEYENVTEDKADELGQTEGFSWIALAEKLIPWGDILDTNHATGPCDRCQVKKMLMTGTAYVGDLPCQWCSKNPYKATCKKIKNMKGETNNE